MSSCAVRHELKITRRDLQAAIDRLKARYAASKNAERIAVRDLSIVSTALNKHDERMTGLLTELSNTKRVIREQAEKMDKVRVRVLMLTTYMLATKTSNISCHHTCVALG